MLVERTPINFFSVLVAAVDGSIIDVVSLVRVGVHVALMHRRVNWREVGSTGLHVWVDGHEGRGERVGLL